MPRQSRSDPPVRLEPADILRVREAEKECTEVDTNDMSMAACEEMCFSCVCSGSFSMYVVLLVYKGGAQMFEHATCVEQIKWCSGGTFDISGDGGFNGIFPFRRSVSRDDVCCGSLWLIVLCNASGICAFLSTLISQMMTLRARLPDNFPDVC